MKAKPSLLFLFAAGVSFGLVSLHGKVTAPELPGKPAGLADVGLPGGQASNSPASAIHEQLGGLPIWQIFGFGEHRSKPTNTFGEGLIVREFKGEYGYANFKGQFVIKPAYAAAGMFHEGLAAVNKAGKWGYLNYAGDFVVAPTYVSADMFHEGLARVSSETQQGFINAFGETVVGPYDATHRLFREGYVGVKVGEKWGYANKANELIIAAVFEDVGEFVDGLALAKTKGRWGFINPAGEYVIAPDYAHATPFKAGASVVQKEKDGAWGYIDRHGQPITSLIYKNARPFFGGFAAVMSEAEGWGFINAGGEYAISPKFDRVGNFHDRLAWVGEKEEESYIDPAGRVIVGPFYRLGEFSEGLAAFVQAKEAKAGASDEDQLPQKNRGFVNRVGAVVIAPQYDEVRNFREGFAAVRLDSKWGYINRSGGVLLPMVFDRAGDFEDGTAPVVKAGRTGRVDKAGHFAEDKSEPGAGNGASNGAAPKPAEPTKPAAPAKPPGKAKK